MTSLPTAMTAGTNARAEAPAGSGVFVGLFAAAGLAAVALQPDAAATGVFAAFLSAMSAGMALIAAHDDAESAFHKAMRLGVRMMAPVLAASLLWAAIAAMQGLFGAGALATVAAIPAFLALIAVESVASVGLQFALSRLAGGDPAVPAALLVADKYAGFAGELR